MDFLQKLCGIDLSGDLMIRQLAGWLADWVTLTYIHKDICVLIQGYIVYSCM